MYQAIVFLPLLGFVIAGLISLAGAHARFPGGSPEPSEGHGHGDAHGGHHHEHRAGHDAHGHADTHGGAHAAEPAAAQAPDGDGTATEAPA